MTDCPNGEVRDLLPDLLHDRLAPDERRRVEAHVASCADCQQELALLRAMRTSLRRTRPANVAAIVAAVPAYRAPARRSRPGWRAAAAILILAAGGTSVAVLQRGDVGVAHSVRAVAAPRELATASGAIGDLNDGELSALLQDLATLEVLPSLDDENAAAVAPATPAGTE